MIFTFIYLSFHLKGLTNSEGTSSYLLEMIHYSALPLWYKVNHQLELLSIFTGNSIQPFLQLPDTHKLSKRTQKRQEGSKKNDGGCTDVCAAGDTELTQYFIIKNGPSATNSAKAEGHRCVYSANTAIKIQSCPSSFPQSNNHLLDVV